MIIAITGNVGSGKSTLAHYISKNYNFVYVPNKRLEISFLDDFFKDIEGKFFPAQVSFLISKAIEIQELVSYQANIVIDRSLLEDIEVFARLWIENKNIDANISKLYHFTAEFIKEAIPAPDVYIVCKCPSDVSVARLSKRPRRSFEELYPPNYIEMLDRYYSELSLGENVPYVEIDTVYYDFTDESTLELICNDIFNHINNNRDYYQLSLFEENTVGLKALMNVKYFNFIDNIRIRYSGGLLKEKGYIYLAAPFTQLAPPVKHESTDEKKGLSLFAGLLDDITYGELPSNYKKKLNKIKKAIQNICEMKVFLPHKDINKWGKASYTSKQITPKVIESVQNAAALIAIPGSSIGVHLELGVAIEKGIPVVIFETEEFINSFFVEGLSELSNVKVIKVRKLTQIPMALEKENIKLFIRRLGAN